MSDPALEFFSWGRAETALVDHGSFDCETASDDWNDLCDDGSLDLYDTATFVEEETASDDWCDLCGDDSLDLFDTATFVEEETSDFGDAGLDNVVLKSLSGGSDFAPSGTRTGTPRPAAAPPQSPVCSLADPTDEGAASLGLIEWKQLRDVKRAKDRTHPPRRRQRFADRKSRTNLHAKKRCRVRSRRICGVHVPKACYRTKNWWDCWCYDPNFR